MPKQKNVTDAEIIEALEASKRVLDSIKRNSDRLIELVRQSDPRAPIVGQIAQWKRGLEHSAKVLAMLV